MLYMKVVKRVKFELSQGTKLFFCLFNFASLWDYYVHQISGNHFMICVSKIMLHALKLTHCCMSVISQHNWKQKNKIQASWPQNLLAEGRPPVVTVELNAPGLGLLWTFIEHLLWASLVTQLVKNPPAMWETWVQSLGWEDPLDREWQSTPVFWPEEFHGL